MFTPLNEDGSYDMTELNRELDRVKTAAFLGKNAAFLGPLMCGMEFIWSEEVETAATDGLHIWWSPKDFLALNHDLRVSTLLHELWHPASLHFVRQGDRDPQDWNIATDTVINNDLLADGYKLQSPEFIWDEQYKGWAVEDIYDKIHEENLCAPRGPGSAEGSGSGEPNKGGTNGKDMIGGLTPAQTQQAINNVVQAVHAAHAAGQPGAVPGHIQQTIKDFLTPIVPWEVLFDRFFEEKCNDDYTYRRPNRRYPDMYMPSLESDDRLCHVIFYEDVSGSISNAECLRFNSEVAFIKERYNPEKLTLVQFDTKIQSEVTLEEDDRFDEVVIVGRGGTCLKEVRKHILDNEPTVAVIFSDLWVQPMEPGPKCPILWVAVNNKQASVPFGQLIHINVR